MKCKILRTTFSFRGYTLNLKQIEEDELENNLFQVIGVK